jgi:hypothetical protein
MSDLYPEPDLDVKIPDSAPAKGSGYPVTDCRTGEEKSEPSGEKTRPPIMSERFYEVYIPCRANFINEPTSYRTWLPGGGGSSRG